MIVFSKPTEEDVDCGRLKKATGAIMMPAAAKTDDTGKRKKGGNRIASLLYFPMLLSREKESLIEKLLVCVVCDRVVK